MGATSVGRLFRCLDDAARARDASVAVGLPDALAAAAARIAEAEHRGGRIIVCGGPDTVTDVDHVVVEFVHPVVTGARSLAAIACHDTDPQEVGRSVRELARPIDVVVVIATSVSDPSSEAAIVAAEQAGASVVTLANVGDADLTVGTIDGIASKELRVVAYHVLWELVQMSLVGGAAMLPETEMRS